MKLIRFVERMEARNAERRRREAKEGRAFGVCWTQSQEALGRELERGETLAVDVYVIKEFEGVRMTRTVERATRDPADRGVVYGLEGQVIGEVAADDSGLLTFTAAGSWSHGV